MKLVNTIIAGAAVLASGGILFAATAAADPSSPAPTPVATVAGEANAAKGAGIGWFYGALTNVQRTCLAEARLQRPEGRLTDAQRTDLAHQVRAALSDCGVTVPTRLADRPRLGFAWATLTPDQQQCLADTKLTRPLGKLTEAQRAAVKQSVKDAVTACR
jgi:mRNA-degrading endonuclease toxin of MazEF toxin-antitoxin module